ncbi:MAG: SipW-dependent-type signal peptide-containing protein [Oscillospiraceae bacterium]
MAKSGESEKKRQTVKRTPLAAAVILLSLAVFGTVLAYYTNSDKAKNTFTVGENENKILESFVPPESQGGDSNKYLKQVQVENTGNVPCYVRVYVDFSDSEILNMSKLSDSDVQYITEAQFYSADPNAADSFANYLNGKTDGKWKYVFDGTLGGYYYYTNVVAPGQSTEPLFRWVDTDYGGDASKVQQYEIMIYSETVQEYDDNGNENGWKEQWESFLQMPT